MKTRFTEEDVPDLTIKQSALTVKCRIFCFLIVLCFVSYLTDPKAATHGPPRLLRTSIYLRFCANILIKRVLYSGIQTDLTKHHI